MSTPNWASEYLLLIDDCMDRDDRLNDWERKFLDDIQRQLEVDQVRLSPKQLNKLDEIWENATKFG